MLADFYANAPTSYDAVDQADLHSPWLLDEARRHELAALQEMFAREWLFYRGDPEAPAELEGYALRTQRAEAPHEALAARLPPAHGAHYGAAQAPRKAQLTCVNPAPPKAAKVLSMAQPTVNMEQALQDPASVFAAPEEVAAHAGLTREQKIEILRLWEYDAAEAEVATEEGMPGGNDCLLHRILRALDGLIGGIDVGDAGPTKQHALLRRRPGPS